MAQVGRLAHVDFDPKLGLRDGGETTTTTTTFWGRDLPCLPGLYRRAGGLGGGVGTLAAHVDFDPKLGLRDGARPRPQQQHFGGETCLVSRDSTVGLGA